MKTMKTRLATIGVAACSLLGMGSAFAQGYVGASAGKAYWSVDCAGLATCDKNDTSYKLFGGYNFSPNFAVEGGYTDLGKIKGSGGGVSGEVKASGFELAAVGKAPVADRFELFGKLGLAVMEAKASGSGFGISASDSTTSTQLMGGVGAAYKFDKQLALRAEYEIRQVKYSGNKDNVGNFTVGLQFSF